MRDDKAKIHPGLVPYQNLTAAEKESNMSAAKTVLRGLQTLGFDIKSKDASQQAVLNYSPSMATYRKTTLPADVEDEIDILAEAIHENR